MGECRKHKYVAATILFWSCSCQKRAFLTDFLQTRPVFLYFLEFCCVACHVHIAVPVSVQYWSSPSRSVLMIPMRSLMDRNSILSRLHVDSEKVLWVTRDFWHKPFHERWVNIVWKWYICSRIYRSVSGQVGKIIIHSLQCGWRLGYCPLGGDVNAASITPRTTKKMWY